MVGVLYSNHYFEVTIEGTFLVMLVTLYEENSMPGQVVQLVVGTLVPKKK